MSGYDLEDVHRPRPAAGWALNARDRLDSLPIKLVRVASTANVATMSGVQTVDGVTLALGDRVLLKNQSTASQNGIWKVKAGTWLRPTDAKNPDHLPAGTIVRATAGTANAGTDWRLTTTGTIVLDTTSLTFVQHGMVGPSSATDGRVATFSGTTGKLLADGGTLLSDLSTTSAMNTAIAAAMPWQITYPTALGYYSTTNGTTAITPDSAAMFALYMRVTTNLNDEMVWKVALGAGTWSLGIICTSAANAPVLTPTLDNGVSITGTFDLYSAGTVKNYQPPALTGITVATTGVYSFKLAALGKNGSSSAYISQVYAFTFKRTA